MDFWWVCGRRGAPCSPTLPPWSNFSIYFFPSGELWSVTIHHRSLWVRIFWLLSWSCELWGKLCWIHVVEFFSIATWSFPCRVLLFSLKIGIPIPLSILHHNLWPAIVPHRTCMEAGALLSVYFFVNFSLSFTELYWHRTLYKVKLYSIMTWLMHVLWNDYHNKSG